MEVASKWTGRQLQLKMMQTNKGGLLKLLATNDIFVPTGYASERSLVDFGNVGLQIDRVSL